jgi:hypothetical protein
VFFEVARLTSLLTILTSLNRETEEAGENLLSEKPVSRRVGHRLINYVPQFGPIGRLLRSTIGGYAVLFSSDQLPGHNSAIENKSLENLEPLANPDVAFLGLVRNYRLDGVGTTVESI